MSNENTPAQDSTEKTKSPPWLRSDNLALWPTKEGDKAVLSGHVTLDDKKIFVRGFINETDAEGKPLKAPYLSLTHNTAAKDADPKWETLARGNAMNHRKDEKPVYFDEVIFNVAGNDKTFKAFVSRDCPAEFQTKLGFAEAVQPRPAKEAPEEVAEQSEDDSPSP